LLINRSLTMYPLVQLEYDEYDRPLPWSPARGSGRRSRLAARPAGDLDGAQNPLAGAARDLFHHIATTR
jgi:hypothetical protein